MKPPEPLAPTDYLVIESTYGDRRHPTEDVNEGLACVVNETAERRAVGRAQHLLHFLAQLRAAHRIPDMPAYLDSPMSIDATGIFCDHKEDLRAAYLHVLADALTKRSCDCCANALRRMAIHGLHGSNRRKGRDHPLGVGLCRQSSRQLLDVTPSVERIREIRAKIEALGDERVIDLHLWEFAPGRKAASAPCGLGGSERLCVSRSGPSCGKRQASDNGGAAVRRRAGHDGCPIASVSAA